jgi:hypothetical protein
VKRQLQSRKTAAIDPGANPIKLFSSYCQMLSIFGYSKTRIFSVEVMAWVTK